jgi:pimeloyl-ACP methyl ester carboxylesterase
MTPLLQALVVINEYDQILDISNNLMYYIKMFINSDKHILTSQKYFTMTNQNQKSTLFQKSIKALSYLSLVALVLTGAGFVYEQYSRSTVAKRYPVQGQLVDLGNGRKMQIDCRGTSTNGSPTVILESGYDGFGSLSWTKVQDQIAKTNQVCSYSRAGVMWSDADTRTFSADNVADDLNLLLKASKITNPIVMVGHSLGGPFIMKYIQKFPNQVKGVVFVDTSHPDEIAKGAALIKDLGLDTTPPVETPTLLIQATLELGIERLFKFQNDSKSTLPIKEAEIADAYFPQNGNTILRQLPFLEKVIVDSGSFRQLGSIPMINLISVPLLDRDPTAQELKDLKMTLAKFNEYWSKNQSLKLSLITERNQWSSNSKSVNLTDADHYIHLQNPDIVIKSVNEVLESVKTGSKLQ